MKRRAISLKKWKFAFGAEENLELKGRMVTVPHTWNLEQGAGELTGTGWYEHMFTAPMEWRDRAVWAEFQAVSFDARVYLNGIQVGEHLHSGYTPFRVMLAGGLKYGETNRLRVMADNTYSPFRLPYMRSFDWANDGGMIREARLVVTGRTFIDRLRVQARPVIEGEGRREEGRGEFSFQVWTGGFRDKGLCLLWELRGEQLAGKGVIASGRAGLGREGRAEVSCAIGSAAYWHFDAPALYRLSLRLEGSEGTLDRAEEIVGFRDLHAQGERLILNGEAVRLCGTEWMPGSHPAYGMAEPGKQLERMLALLKESNCALTRFHWQQDDQVYDWCDRHGILVQEEVPFWGKEPKIPGPEQWEAFKEQAEEMTAAHGNHPCIISWGVGNELDGQAEETAGYIKKAAAYMKRLDPDRPANYVSNTFFKGPDRDGTIYGDFLMINEYSGTWRPERDGDVQIERLLKAAPGKPLIPAEFGLCEPAFPGGDPRREEIFLEKIRLYRRYPEIGGAIYFCLNDYRTQMGEESQGDLRLRIHGSATLEGAPKPSYYAVQRECAPFEARQEREGLRLLCRKDLPAYAMKGYTAEVISKKGEKRRERIGDLKPGESWLIKAEAGDRVEVYRPAGWIAGSFLIGERLE